MSNANGLWHLRFTEVLFVMATVTVCYQLIQGHFSGAIVFWFIFSCLLFISSYKWQAIIFWPVMAIVFFLFWSNGTWHTQKPMINNPNAELPRT
jgi:cell division protein FtsW (lipid II flippase)